MKQLTVLLFVCALVFSANALAQCTQPPVGTVINLKTVSLPNGRNTVDVGVLVNDRVVRIPVPKATDFCVEQTGKDAFWVKYRVLAYCDSTNWVAVQDTKLELKRSEKQPEPIRLPPTRVVKPGEGWKTLSKELGVPADTLRAWNGLERRHVLPGEHIFTAAPADKTVIRRWEFLKGAPAKKKLIKQIEDPRVPVPEYVKNEWKSLIEASRPDTVRMYSTPEHPLFHDFICYGDDVVWLKTVCFWKDPKTLEPITMTLALEYPPVDYQGNRYYLYQYLACNNAAGSIIPIVDEGSTEVTVQPPATEEKKPEPPTTTDQAPPPRETSHEFVQGGVWWLDYRYAQGGKDRKGNLDRQHSFLGGLEWLPRISGYDGWGRLRDLSTVVRIEQASLDKNHVSGEYRLGGRGWILGDEAGSWRTGFEAGAWYLASQREFVNYQQISPSTIEAREDARYFDGYGGYGRILGITPKLGYYEGMFKRGTNLDREIAGSFSIEPHPLYFRASYDVQYRRGQSRHFDNQTLSFPADTMQVFEGRIGYKFNHYVIVYASYDSWSYDNPSWSFDWRGPGIGIEYRINRWWRLKGHFKYLNDATDRDLVNGKVYHTDRQWAGIGLDHSW